MPNYVTITPKYQVVDLADMLKVPEMLVAEQDKANKELEDYKDQISKYRALLGDNADKYFGNYDDLMNTLVDNPTIADRKSIANQLRTRFRDVSAKAELAAPALQKWSDYFAKNPHLVGNPGTIDTYMENPNYTPVISDSKALQNDLEDLLIRDLSQQAPKAIGHMEGDPSTLVVRQGRSNEEIAGVIQNTIDALRRGEEPVDVLSKDMYNAALKQGYNNQDEAGKRRLEQSLWKAAPAGFAKTSTKADPEYRNQSQRIQDAINNERLKAIREETKRANSIKALPKGFDTFEDDNYKNRYAYKQDSHGHYTLKQYNPKTNTYIPVPFKSGEEPTIYLNGIPFVGHKDAKGNEYFTYNGGYSGTQAGNNYVFFDVTYDSENGTKISDKSTRMTNSRYHQTVSEYDKKITQIRNNAQQQASTTKNNIKYTVPTPNMVWISDAEEAKNFMSNVRGRKSTGKLYSGDNEITNENKLFNQLENWLHDEKDNGRNSHILMWSDTNGNVYIEAAKDGRDLSEEERSQYTTSSSSMSNVSLEN